MYFSTSSAADWLTLNAPQPVCQANVPRSAPGVAPPLGPPHGFHRGLNPAAPPRLVGRPPSAPLFTPWATVRRPYGGGGLQLPDQRQAHRRTAGLGVEVVAHRVADLLG